MGVGNPGIGSVKGGNGVTISVDGTFTVDLSGCLLNCLLENFKLKLQT